MSATPTASLVLALCAGVWLAPSRARAQTDLELEAAADVSGRPDVCRSAESAPWSWLWQVSGRPNLAKYCNYLAIGSARLAAHPEYAAGLADSALAILPGDGAATLLRARALCAAGKAGCWETFRAARRTLGVIESPRALREFAIAALATGHEGDAIEAYRALVTRSFLLGDELSRQRSHIEGALVVMHQGPRGAVEAVSYLTEVRRGAVLPGLGDYLAGALALALDRQGRVSEAQGVLAETTGPWDLLETFGQGEIDAGTDRARLSQHDAGRTEAGALATGRLASAPIAVTVADLTALTAILAETADAAVALEQWQSYLGLGRVPSAWRAHAEAKVQKFKRMGAGR